MNEKENKIYNLSDIIGDGAQLAQGNYFVPGDWACVKESGKKGLVKETTGSEWDQSVRLLMEDGTILEIHSDECTFTTPDPKTAFLTELSELLRKYDAKIRWSIGLTYEDRMRSSANIEVHTPNFDHYFSGETGVTLTADNVFNYDKE